MAKSIHLFISSLSSGGAERQISILANFLAEKGYITTLVTFLPVEDLYPLHPLVKRVNLGFTGNRFYKQWVVTKYFLRVKTDCIISYLSGPNFKVLWPMLLRPNVNVIVGERNYYTNVDNIIDKINYNFLYRRANYVVCNNYSQASFLQQYRDYLKGKTLTIVNYTDTDIFKVSKINVTQYRRIGVFCRYTEQKNYLRFAEALVSVRGAIGDEFHVDWYGDKDSVEGSPGFKILTNFIRNNNLWEVFSLYGFTKSVPEEMAKYDAICLPSLYEGFSNTLSEAICCGKPVLASNVSDNPIMVHDNENGYLFNPYDVDEIASTLVRFLRLEENEIIRMGENSRAIAERLFNKNTFINSYINLIEK